MAPQQRFGNRSGPGNNNRFQVSRPTTQFNSNRDDNDNGGFGSFSNEKPRSFCSSSSSSFNNKKPFPANNGNNNFRDNDRNDRFSSGGGRYQQQQPERRDFSNNRNNEDRSNYSRQPSFESRRFERSSPASFGSRDGGKNDGAVLSITNVPASVKEFEVRKFFEKYGQVTGYNHDGRIAKVKFSSQRQCSDAYQAEKGRLTFAGKLCDLSLPVQTESRRDSNVATGFGHVDDNVDSRRRSKSTFGNRRNNESPAADKRSFGKRTRSSSPRPYSEGRRDFDRDVRDRDYQTPRKNRFSDPDTNNKPDAVAKGSEIPYPFRSVPEVVIFIDETCYDRHMDFLRKKLIEAGFVIGTIKRSDPNVVAYAKKQLHAFAQRGTKIALAISQENIGKKEFIDRGWKLMTTPGAFGDYIDTEMADMAPFNVIKSLGGQVPSPFPKKNKKQEKEPELYPRPNSSVAVDSNDSADEPESLDKEFGKVKAGPSKSNTRRAEVVENHFGEFEVEIPLSLKKTGSKNLSKQTKSTVQGDWMEFMGQSKNNLQWSEWPKETKKTSKNNHLLWPECQVKPSSQRPAVASKSEKIADPRRRAANSVASSSSPPTPSPESKKSASVPSVDMNQNSLMAQMNPAQMQMLMMQMMMGQMNPQMGAMMETFMRMQQGSEQQSKDSVPSFESQMSNMMAGANPMSMGMGGYPNFGMDAFQPLGAVSSSKSNDSNKSKNVPTEGMEQVQLMNQLLKSMTSNQ